MAADKIDLMVYFIQHGDNSLMEELWKDIRGLVAWYAIRFMRQIDGSRFGVTEEDLIQTGYLALVDAVRLYDPEQGASFATYLSYHLRRQFHEALGRTNRKRRDMLNCAASLDEPYYADEPEGISLIENIADERDQYAEVDKKIFIQQLHEALENVLERIPNREADVLRARYFDEETLQVIAAKRNMCFQNVRQIEMQGLRNMRKPNNRRELEQFLDSYTPFYHHTGPGWYQRTGMSSVEYNVLLRERKEREYAGNLY